MLKMSRELYVKLLRGTLRTSRHWYVRLGVRLEMARAAFLQLVLRRGVWPARRGVTLVQWIEVQMGVSQFLPSLKWIS